MSETPADIDKLRRLVTTLRSPDGCPWDREQTLSSVRAYLLEEAHEVADALDQLGNGTGGSELGEELGDLLFQVVFLARLAEEEGMFDLAQAIDGVHDKMVQRHPHVFGEDQLTSAEEVARAWELRKQSTGDTESRRSALDGVPSSLPALLGGYRIGQKAAGLGFDWPDIQGVWSKVHEELGELEEQIDLGDRQAAEEELGDLLFTLTSVARHLKIDPERALAGANLKFRKRFSKLEEGVAGNWQDQSLAQLEALWEDAKRNTSSQS